MRTEQELRYVIVEDWQPPESPSLADAPELRVVLAERGVKLISKAVFSDFVSPEKPIVEVLVLDADRPAADAIGNALAAIRARLREETTADTKRRRGRRKTPKS